MTTDELYQELTSKMTPETALKNILESQMDIYGEDNVMNPIVLAVMAANELKWNIAIDTSTDDVQGLIMGTDGYVNNVMGIEKEAKPNE